MAVNEIEQPNSQIVRFTAQDGLLMDAGLTLAPLQIAYQTYGALNADRSNAILVCHALTGDQHAANVHPLTGKPGWWSVMVGPGKPIDTDRYFVICSNVIGGCMGSTGPASINTETGKPWGLGLPIVTIRDMVRAQAKLIDHLGIDTLFCVAGGSMGGMQVLQWMASYPQRVFSAMPIATAPKHSAQNIAFHEVGRQAVMADPEWKRRTLCRNRRAATAQGARRRAHGRAYHLSFGGRAPAQVRPQAAEPQCADFLIRCGFPDRELPALPGHEFRRSLRREFVSLHVTRACDYFDLAEDYGGRLADAFRGSSARVCVVSFTSDWLYPTSDARLIVHALNAAGMPVSFVEIATDKGHDAFLVDEPEFLVTTRGFLDSAATLRGLARRTKAAAVA